MNQLKLICWQPH